MSRAVQKPRRLASSGNSWQSPLSQRNNVDRPTPVSVANRGLTLIGIHTPEFPPYAGEHDRGNVQRALDQYHIRYPNAQDNDRRTWDLYGIRFWPSFVLIDKRGNIRYEGAGEFHLNDRTYQLWQHRIEELLAE